ncbi:MAG: hypothetical protein FWB90_09765 [Fibromonadales bacterium]|nr:hypothetical protein [Fibromonadales bacterium]
MKKNPPKFNCKHWNDVFNVAEIFNFNEIELRGEKRGVLKGILKVAKNMLDQGLKPRTIARCTELPLKQIMALR